MQTGIKKLPKSQIEIIFEISSEEFKIYIENAISNLGKDLEIQGFRKGQAPKEIVVQNLDQEKILNLAVQSAVEKNYFQEISAQKLEVISKPEIKILSEVDFNRGLTFRAIFTIMPEINLPDYKKLAAGIKRKKITVEEKEVKNALLYIQKSRAKFIFENRPARKGDFVEIEFRSPQIENNLKRKDSFVLSQGHFVASFEENLEGMAPGQEKEFSVKFPENYSSKNLAGQVINFKTKMISVQKMELPEINDEFAKGLGKFENLIALTKNIGEGIKMEKENQESQRVRGEILGKINNEAKIEIPEVLIETEKRRMLEDLKRLVLEKLRMSFENYLTEIKKTEKELLDSFSSEAERKINCALVLKEISKREKISVVKEEIETAVNEFLKNYPGTEKAKKELDLENLKSYYEEAIRNEKTLQFLEKLSQR